MDNNQKEMEKTRRYDTSFDDYAFMMAELDQRKPNEIADDNYEQALEGAKQFQEELYREVLLARGVDPDEVNIDSLIAGEITMDEVVEDRKPKL